jgi:molybdate transport system ATP-binding protein
MVTHDSNEALALAHRVIVLFKGQIRQTGTPEEVFSRPADEEVASLVDTGNILHGTVIKQSDGLASISIGKQKIEAVSELNAGTRVTVLLHHHDITIALPPSGTLTASARNQLPGHVIRVFPIGSQLRVTIDCGFPLVALITRHSWVDMGLSIGQEVIASFKASSIRVIPNQFKTNTGKKGETKSEIS